MKREKQNLTEWWEFLIEKKSKRVSRKSGKGLERSLEWFLDSGPQKKGGYQNTRPRMGRKKFNDISAPPGAPGGLEEEVDPDSFKYHDHLNPHIWEDSETLDADVRDRLLTIAMDFLDSLDMGIDPLDVRLTGSIANYNWSDYSDIDLHIVVDFSSLDSDPELVKKYFDAARMRWNDKHDIGIYGYEVEIYIEDANEEHRSSGIYSLPQQEWIVEPTLPESETSYSHTARKKSDDILTQINLIQLILPRKPKAALRSIERLKKKISRMRSAALNSPEQENAIGNVVFKILRREDALKQLSDLKDLAYDTAFSVK